MDIREKVKGLLCGMGVVFLLLVASGVVYKIYKGRTYEAKVGVNLVVVGESGMAIVGLRKNEELFIWTNIPADLRVNAYGTGGRYPVSSLWELGKIEGNAIRVVKESIGRAFGIPIAGVVKINDRSSDESLLGNMLSIRTQTDLGVLERLRIYNEVKYFVLRNQTLQVDIPKGSLDREEDIDGKLWLKLNETIYTWSSSQFIFEQIVSRRIEAKVINASMKTGKSWEMVRMLETAGIRVVAVEGVETGEFKKKCYYSLAENDAHVEIILHNQLGCSRRKDVVEGKTIEVYIGEAW